MESYADVSAELLYNRVMQAIVNHQKFSKTYEDHPEWIKAELFTHYIMLQQLADLAAMAIKSGTKTVHLTAAGAAMMMCYNP